MDITSAQIQSFTAKVAVEDMSRCGRNIGRRILDMGGDIHDSLYLFFPAQWADTLMSSVLWELESNKKKYMVGCYWLKTEKAKDGTDMYILNRQYRETPIEQSFLVIIGKKYPSLVLMRNSLRKKFRKELRFSMTILVQALLDKRLMFFPQGRTPHLIKGRRIISTYVDENLN